MVTVRGGRGEGLRLVIDPQAEKYYWSGLYEDDLQREITEHLSPGDVMWDVGAHIGFISAIASRSVGPTGQVLAFEPLPGNISRLRQTVEANQLANVTIREVAVSSSIGTSPFYIHSSTSMGGLEAREGAPTINVPTTTLDSEITSRRPPMLVKIDVEGFEDDVIAGGKRLFDDIIPVIVIELLNDAAVARAKVLLPNYTLRRIDGTNFIGERSAQ
jgi:FkbM family methyltransferase